ncbi:hypothetical protein LCGC14_1324870 [marine sediment metagenome]|uniref:Methyltransferase type 11 domain-containing protein n=1 Tax=marine sediment metagenome TaxID=412755 RepID=A0A0F9KII0_9ZZZZ|nr:class I SAM-dependent methyltransferase [bacterium]
MNKEKLKEYYKKKEVTETYDIQREGTEYRKKKRRTELRIFLIFLDKQKGEKVLELGCSGGFLTQQLGKVTAIDTSKEMLKITKKRNPNAKVLEADMFSLPFKDKSFDKIVTMRVWTHLNKKDLGSALKESKRVLKSGGVLIFDSEERNWIRKFINFFYKRIFKITGFKIYQHSLKKLKTIIEENGFTLERVGYLKHRIGRQIILKIKKIK